MTTNKHFDDIIRDKGGELPYPVMEPNIININDAIREQRSKMTQLEWEGKHETVQTMLGWLRYLQGEKKRGIVRMQLGWRPIKEIK